MSEPRALVQALADRRAAVLTGRAEEGLASLDVRGSQAWDADAAALSGMAAASQRYEGVRFSVVSARTVRHDGGRAALVRGGAVARSRHAPAPTRAAGQFTWRSRPAQYCSRSLNFCTLPVAVRGMASRSSTDVGAL